MQTDIVSRLLKSAESTVLDRAAKGFKTDTATTIQAVAAAYIERLEEALQEWREARLAAVEVGVGHVDYMGRLARLSEAEESLNTLRPQHPQGGE